MSVSLNKVQLIGNCGAAPTTRYTPKGVAICTVSLATTDTWKDKETGEKKELTEWHRLVFRAGLAEVVAKYVTKGSQIYIEGKNRTRKWTDDKGVDRYITEIYCDEMKMLGKKPADERAETPPPSSEQQPGGPAIDEDDIPF